MFPAQSYLANPVACGWVNPRHRGVLIGSSTTPPTFPVVEIQVPSGTNFNTLTNFDYDFEETLPPGPGFDAIFVLGEEPPTNVEDLTEIVIFNTDDPASELFGDTIISTSPDWPGATFTTSTTTPSLSGNAGAFPGLSTILQFRNVPVIANITIRIFGND